MCVCVCCPLRAGDRDLLRGYARGHRLRTRAHKTKARLAPTRGKRGEKTKTKTGTWKRERCFLILLDLLNSLRKVKGMMEREMHTRQAGERREGRCGGAGDARGGRGTTKGAAVCRAWCRGRPGRQTQSRSLFAALACSWAKQTKKRIRRNKTKTITHKQERDGPRRRPGFSRSLSLSLLRDSVGCSRSSLASCKILFIFYFLSRHLPCFFTLLASLALLFNLAPLDVLFFFSRRAPWRRCRSGRRWGQQRARARPRRRRRARGRA